jgi:molecular chaperone DnaK (HSP70)
MQIRSVGIDLGKTTFHLVALGASGKVLVKKKKHGNRTARLLRPSLPIAPLFPILPALP